MKSPVMALANSNMVIGSVEGVSTAPASADPSTTPVSYTHLTLPTKA